MEDNAAKVGDLIDRIIDERAEGNPAIVEMTKAKLILKGINPDRYYNDPLHKHPDMLEKLIEINHEWNAETPKFGSDVLLSASSQMGTEEEVVLDIQSQLKNMEVKTLIFFASSAFKQDRLSRLMKKAFNNSVVFGCSSTGERYNDRMLRNSLVALALSPKLVADAKSELLQNISTDLNIRPIFKSFGDYFMESIYKKDSAKYLGIILSDGKSSKEEAIMDGVGNLTNINFIGASTGFHQEFDETYVYSNGEAYSNAAVFALLKMQDNASFDILMTQSFSPLEQTLVATKVDVENRSVIEFNDRPAAEEYARSLGISGVDELPKYFLSHPVGLVINDRKVLIRTPVSISGTSIKFSSSILKDMEVTLLESGDIIERTREAVDQRLQESDGKTVGILSFECGYRRDELEEKNLTEQYGKIFSTIPNVGFDSHGEAYIGHMSQSAIMVFFKYDANLPGKQDMSIFSAAEGEKNRLSQINRDLELENMELRRKLDITATELKRFNVSLVEEMNYRTEREEMIRQMSYHDELTNLYNRRYFVDHLSTLDVEENLPLSVIYCDVDNLKITNDTFGHDKGDKLLKKAATSIKDSCRECGIVIRIGGDEFLVLLPKTPRDVALEIVERIHNNASKESINNNPIRVSFGLDTKDSLTQDINDVIKSAEKLMYKHKFERKTTIDQGDPHQ